MALAAVALFWYGIRRGLKPLERLRAEIASRSPTDLRPVVEEDKPQEIRPLVGALNQLLTRLNAAIDSQKRFIANAAHQLRTPLAGLKTHAELARRDPDPAEMRALLDMIAGETERTSHLVNQLLTLARTEPGVGPVSGREPVNLHDVASRAVQSWVPKALAKNIDLGFELEDAWTLGDAAASARAACQPARQCHCLHRPGWRGDGSHPRGRTAMYGSKWRTTASEFLNRSARTCSSASTESPAPAATGAVSAWRLSARSRTGMMPKSGSSPPPKAVEPACASSSGGSRTLRPQSDAAAAPCFAGWIAYSSGSQLNISPGSAGPACQAQSSPIPGTQTRCSPQ